MATRHRLFGGGESSRMNPNTVEVTKTSAGFLPVLVACWSNHDLAGFSTDCSYSLGKEMRPPAVRSAEGVGIGVAR